MLNHILAVVTTAKGADMMLAHTKCMARAVGAKITLLRLLNPVPDVSRSTVIVDPLDWHIRKLEVEATLSQMAKSLRELGYDTSTAILEGADAELLMQYAESNGVSLILLAKEPEYLGDLIHNVIKRTTLPILVLPTDELWFGVDIPDCYRRVVVPLDGSQRAEVTLPVAKALMNDQNARFILAHIVHRPEMPRHAPHNPEETELVERIVELNRTEGERYLDAFAGRMTGEIDKRLIVSDNVVSALHDLIEQESADLIIVSAHGYSGKPQWPYGSVTANLLTYSTRPVLVVQDLPAVPAGGSSAIPAVRLFRQAR